MNVPDPTSPNMVESLDTELIGNLEIQQEYTAQQLSAFEIVCGILTQNMILSDLVTFRKYRQLQMQRVLQEISLSNMNHSNELNHFY